MTKPHDEPKHKAHEEPHKEPPKKAHPDVLPHEDVPKAHPARSSKPAPPPDEPLREDLRAFSAALRGYLATQNAATWQVCVQSGGYLIADAATALPKGAPKPAAAQTPATLPDCAAALEAAAFAPTIDLGWLLQLILSILSGLFK